MPRLQRRVIRGVHLRLLNLPPPGRVSPRHRVAKEAESRVQSCYAAAAQGVAKDAAQHSLRQGRPPVLAADGVQKLGSASLEFAGVALLVRTRFEPPDASDKAVFPFAQRAEESDVPLPASRRIGRARQDPRVEAPPATQRV